MSVYHSQPTYYLVYLFAHIRTLISLDTLVHCNIPYMYFLLIICIRDMYNFSKPRIRMLVIELFSLALSLTAYYIIFMIMFHYQINLSATDIIISYLVDLLYRLVKWLYFSDNFTICLHYVNT